MYVIQNNFSGPKKQGNSGSAKYGRRAGIDTFRWPIYSVDYCSTAMCLETG